MKKQIAVGVVLGGTFLGFLAWGSARTNAQSNDRIVKQEPRVLQPEKVETAPRTPVQVLTLRIDAKRPTLEQSQVVGGHVFSNSERSVVVASGTSGLEALPTPEQVEGIEDPDKRMVISKAIELCVRAVKADSMTDEELENYLLEVALYSATLRVGLAQGPGSSSDIGGTQIAVDGGGTEVSQTPGECTTDCHTRRNNCLEQECWDNRGWPCVCCIGCNLMELVCYTACIFQAMA